MQVDSWSGADDWSHLKCSHWFTDLSTKVSVISKYVHIIAHRFVNRQCEADMLTQLSHSPTNAKLRPLTGHHIIINIIIMITSPWQLTKTSCCRVTFDLWAWPTQYLMTSHTNLITCSVTTSTCTKQRLRVLKKRSLILWNPLNQDVFSLA